MMNCKKILSYLLSAALMLCSVGGVLPIATVTADVTDSFAATSEIDLMVNPVSNGEEGATVTSQDNGSVTTEVHTAWDTAYGIALYPQYRDLDLSLYQYLYISITSSVPFRISSYDNTNDKWIYFSSEFYNVMYPIGGQPFDIKPEDGFYPAGTYQCILSYGDVYTWKTWDGESGWDISNASVDAVYIEGKEEGAIHLDSLYLSPYNMITDTAALNLIVSPSSSGSGSVVTVNDDGTVDAVITEGWSQTHGDVAYGVAFRPQLKNVDLSVYNRLSFSITSEIPFRIALSDVSDTGEVKWISLAEEFYDTIAPIDGEPLGYYPQGGFFPAGKYQCTVDIESVYMWKNFGQQGWNVNDANITGIFIEGKTVGVFSVESMKLVGDVTINQGLAVFTNNLSMDYKAGEYLVLAVSEAQDDDYSTPENIVVTIENGRVVSLQNLYTYADILEGHFFANTQSFPEQFRNSAFVVLRAEREGFSNVILTNTATGHTQNLFVSVSEDEYASLRAGEVPSHIVSGEQYNYYINGVVISDFAYQTEGDGYRFTMNTYNRKYSLGVVEVFNADGSIRKVVPIEKFAPATSVAGTFVEGWYLLEDSIKGEALTFKARQANKHTPIDVWVPQDGYIRITNDSAVSTTCWLLNLVDAVLSAGNVMEGATGILSAEQTQAVASEAIKHIIRDAYYFETAKQFQEDMAKLIIGEASETAVIECMTQAAHTLKEFLTEIDISFEDICKASIGTAATIAEKTFESLTSFIGVGLSGMMYVREVANYSTQVLHWVTTTNRQCFASVMTPYRSNSEGGLLSSADNIQVDTNGQVDTEAILQTFRILKGDSIKLELQSGEILNDYVLYDISLIKNGKEVQPNGNVNVYIRVPDGFGDKIQVCRLTESGGWEYLDATVENGIITIEVDHFCVFAFADVDIATAQPANGDVNGDGMVRIGDAVLLYYHDSGKLELDAQSLARGEVNGDGAMGIQDAVLLYYSVAGKIPFSTDFLDRGEEVNHKSDDSYCFFTVETVESYYEIHAGDELAVEIKSSACGSIGGMYLSLSYDPLWLEVVSTEESGWFENMSMSDIEAEEEAEVGIIRMAGMDLNGVSSADDEVIATVIFRATQDITRKMFLPITVQDVDVVKGDAEDEYAEGVDGGIMIIGHLCDTVPSTTTTTTTSTATATAAGDPYIVFTVETVQYVVERYGDPIPAGTEVEVNIFSGYAECVKGIGLNVQYDPTKWEVVSATTAGWLAKTDMNDVRFYGNEIRVNCMHLEGIVAENEVIATITFRALTDIGDDSPLIVTAADVLGKDDNVVYKASGIDGAIGVQPPACTLPPDFVEGDFNNDGKVTITDAVMFYYHVNGKTPLKDASSADLNGDGKINISDAVKLYYFVNGKIESL